MLGPSRESLQDVDDVVAPLDYKAVLSFDSCKRPRGCGEIGYPRFICDEVLLKPKDAFHELGYEFRGERLKASLRREFKLAEAHGPLDAGLGDLVNVSKSHWEAQRPRSPAPSEAREVPRSGTVRWSAWLDGNTD